MNLKETKTIGTICYLGNLPFVFQDFCYSWSKMVEFNATHMPGRIDYQVIKVSELSHARDLAAKNMKGEFLLMIDADNSFEPDLAFNMLNLMKKFTIPVLTGVYLLKTEPHSPVIYSYDKDADKYRPLKGWKEDMTGKIFQIGASGAGCLMIRRDVFNVIEQELKETPFGIYKNYGEDISFFDRLRRLDIPVFCSTDVTVNHLMSHPLTIGVDYNPVLKNQDKNTGFKAKGLV